jgi:competence protein ComEC
MVLFKKLFQYKKLYFTQLDTLSLCGILMLIFNPRLLFSLSFELSFLVSFIIVIFTKNFKIENKIIQTYITSFIAFLVTLPFIININYEVNLLSILVGPLYVLYFELLLYPATLIMMFIPNIHLLFDYIFIFFESSLNALDSIKNLILIFGKLDLVSFILYEIILYFLLVSFEVKRGRILLSLLMSIFLIFVYNKAFFNPFYTLKMYDVGQGDSLLLTLPNGRGNILFDCYNNIDIHLKKDGIKDIDIIFLSHGHDDHINAFEEIVSSYNVSKIYSSYYDNTTLLNDLKDRYKISLLKSEQKVIYKDFVCEVLGPIKMYSNENDNSLVLKVMIDDLTILFTGDIEKTAERDLVDKYGDKLKSDILKTPHHGSSTSSSKEFLGYVDPKFILISVGRNNKYNFPNNKYLLSLSNIYRTDLDNSIIIYKRKKLFYIK